jgi:hypothetical protein
MLFFQFSLDVIGILIGMYVTYGMYHEAFCQVFFELLIENFSARREMGKKRGAKRACGRLEAVFAGR